MQDIKTIFDIGNGYIKGVVFGEEEGKVVPLVKEIVKTKGLRKGKILDSEKLSEVILEVIEGFSRKLGGDFIDEVIVGISHPQMEIERITETKRIMNGIVHESDINHLSKIVLEISQKENMEVIKVAPVYWIIDDVKREKDPVGLQAKKLGLTADVFRISKSFYTGLLDIFEKIGLTVIDMVPGILATVEAVLDFDQKDLGTMVIDIGTNQTSYAIFEDGYPLCYGVLPIGGEDVTKDISITMKMDIAQAEDLKVAEGVILNANAKNLDTQLNVGFLSEVIKARYEEIFEKINKHLCRLQKDGRLPGGVILSGGGSKMEGLVELAKEVFKLAVFEGKEVKLHIPDMSKNKQFINVLGLYTRHQNYGIERKPFFSFNLGIFKGILKFFKNLF